MAGTQHTNTISIRVSFTDDNLYENFIEPRKISSELPGLVARLLTVYAYNDDLANQIDQVFDEHINPEVYAARAAILDAIAHVNKLDAMANQEIESIDAGSGVKSDDDDYDMVTPATGTGAPVDVPDGFGEYSSPQFNFEPVAIPANEQMPHYTDEDAFADEVSVPESDTNTHSEQVTTPVSSEGIPAVGADTTVVLNSIETLTTQVSSLTNAVSQMVSLFSSGAVTQPIASQSVVSQPEIVHTPVSASVQPAPVATVAQQTAAQPVVQPDMVAQPVAVAQQTPVQLMKPPAMQTQAQPVVQPVSVQLDKPVAQPANISSLSQVAPVAQSTAPVDIPIEVLQGIAPISENNETPDDDYAVPDFMDDMLAGLD